jgi:hypothetical protein
MRWVGKTALVKFRVGWLDEDDQLELLPGVRLPPEKLLIIAMLDFSRDA